MSSNTIYTIAAWQHLVESAMLGSDKMQPSSDLFTGHLDELYRVVNKNEATDTEEKVLQLTAAVANYRRCGTKPLQVHEISTNEAPPEHLPYCSQPAARVLRHIINEENKSLLQLWLEQCAERQCIVVPELLPLLLNAAERWKLPHALVTAVGGKRALWLAGYNSRWQLAPEATDEAQWQEGTTEQRAAALSHMRMADPETARNELVALWSKESANVRATFLSILEINLSDADLPWLEALIADKSQKVKEVVFRLLRRLPASAVVQEYQRLAPGIVAIRKEKKLLGLSSRQVLSIQLPEPHKEALYATGISKTSSYTGFANDESVIYDFITGIPPQFWETSSGMTAAAIIAVFEADKNYKKYLPAIAAAAIAFKDVSWLMALAQNDAAYYPELIPHLPEAARKAYLLKGIESAPDAVIEAVTHDTEVWDQELAAKILQHTAAAPYQYNRGFYSRNIHLLPFSVKDILPQVGATNKHSQYAWESMKEHIERLLSLKQDIYQSFNQR